MRYHIVDTNEYFEDEEQAVDYCIADDYHEDDDYFEEWLNDDYGRLEIRGHTFTAYEVLNEMNSGLLEDLRNEFCEGMNETDREEALYELRHMQNQHTVYCQGYEIEIVDDEDEENGEEQYEEPACGNDGDEYVENAIEMTRRFIEDQRIIREYKESEDKKNEKDLMSLFQTITA